MADAPEYAKPFCGLYDEWVEFANRTFPNKPEGKLEHIIDECNEVLEHLKENGGEKDDKFYEECADIWLILTHLTNDHYRFEKAISDKMHKNYGRQWGQPNANGMVVHLKGIND